MSPSASLTADVCSLSQNVQVLSLSAQQKELMSAPLDRPRRAPSAKWNLSGIRKRWIAMTLVTKTLSVIAVAAVIQVRAAPFSAALPSDPCPQLMISLVVFFVSRRFHSSFGMVSQPSNTTTCRQGWEW